MKIRHFRLIYFKIFPLIVVCSFSQVDLAVAQSLNGDILSGGNWRFWIITTETTSTTSTTQPIDSCPFLDCLRSVARNNHNVGEDKFVEWYHSYFDNVSKAMLTGNIWTCFGKSEEPCCPNSQFDPDTLTCVRPPTTSTSTTTTITLKSTTTTTSTARTTTIPRNTTSTSTTTTTRNTTSSTLTTTTTRTLPLADPMPTPTPFQTPDIAPTPFPEPPIIPPIPPTGTELTQ